MKYLKKVNTLEELRRQYKEHKPLYSVQSVFWKDS